MKCGIHSYVFYPEPFLINELSLELARRGHEVHVSTGLPNYISGSFQKGYTLVGPYSETYEKINIKRFPVIPRKKGLAYLALNYASNLFMGILNLIRLPKSDISFVFSGSPIFVVIPPLLLKKFTGTPVVMWLQDLWPESFSAVARISEHHPFYKLLELVVRWIYRNVDVVLVQSEAFRANPIKYGFRGRIEYIPNWGPDVTESSQKEEPQWLRDLPQDRFILTFAGNIGKAQALDTLLDVARELGAHTRALFVLAGDGSDLDRLKARVQDENIPNVLFIGRKPLSEMPSLFRRSSCLYVSLAPDFLFSQVIPSKVQAYMASGRPILASLDGEGARVITESNGGFAIPAASRELLKNCLDQLLSKTSQELDDLGQKSRTYYLKHFERTMIIDRIEQILKESIQ